MMEDSIHLDKIITQTIEANWLHSNNIQLDALRLLFGARCGHALVDALQSEALIPQKCYYRNHGKRTCVCGNGWVRLWYEAW